MAIVGLIMFGTLFLFSLAIMLLYKFLVSVNRIRARGINWPRVGRYAGVAGVIVVCEALAPSFVLTGHRLPVPAVPARHMDSIPMAREALSYADFAERASWAWSLGSVSRSEMERRIDADIATATEMLEASTKLEEQLPDSSVFSRLYGSRVPKLSAYIEGLQAARVDLDALFVTPQRLDAPFLVASKADSFIYQHIRRVLDVRKVALDTARYVATDALVEYKALKGDALDPDAPEYLALTRAASETVDAMMGNYGPMNDLDMVRYSIEARANDHSVDKIVPQFRRPVQVFQDRRTVLAPSHAITAPPAPMSVKRVTRALSDAVKGYSRASDTVIEEHRCAIAIVDRSGTPMPEKVCESAVILPVRYDLTALQCGAGIAPQACRERWDFPHLNVVYEQDRFTVYTPLSVAADTRMSVWHVSWGGVEQALTPSATFMWDGRSDVLAGLIVRHDVGPDVVKPLIWADMRGADPDADLSGANSFAPVTLSGPQIYSQSEIAPEFMSLGENIGARTTNPDWRIPKLRSAFEVHENLLSTAAREVRTPAAASGGSGLTDVTAPCTYMKFFNGGEVDVDIVASIRGILNVEDGQVCNAIFEYATVLQTLKRSTSGGSWLWMFQLSR